MGHFIVWEHCATLSLVLLTTVHTNRQWSAMGMSSEPYCLSDILYVALIVAWTGMTAGAVGACEGVTVIHEWQMSLLMVPATL